MIAYAVAVRREDGTEVLMSLEGLYPSIYKDRTEATEAAMPFISFGVIPRVVKVEYTEPRIVED